MKRITKSLIMLMLMAGLLIAVSACSDAQPKTFTVKYYADIGGVISGEKIQTIKEGQDSDLVIAIPNEGYVFLNWSDGETFMVRQDKNVQKNISVTARFEFDTSVHFEAIYSASTGGYIVGQAEQDILYGEDAESITAMPDIGYKFVKWSDGITTAIRQDTEVRKKINVIAEFDYVLYGGIGTAETPCLIENYEQLLDIKLYPSLYYKLSNDLDLHGINHKPLFDNTSVFDGVFDGNGYSICNMKVNTYSACPSLFGRIDSGSVKDLNIIDFKITVPNFVTSGGSLCVGSVASDCRGYLSNIYANGIINGSGLTYDGVAIGGLVGQSGGIVTNCDTDVFIEINNVERSNTKSYPFNIGGLVGVGFANIRSCTVQGTINVSYAHNGVLIGGLVGYFLANEITDNFEIADCITDMEIFNGIGSFSYSAGLISNVSVTAGELYIKNCAVWGNITDGDCIGGFINDVNIWAISKLTIINSYVKNDITINGMAAGFVYSISNNSDGVFEINNCYSEGSITASMAAGFCYVVAKNVNFYRCYSASNISSQAGTAGFVALISGGGIIEECFTSGTIMAVHQAAGFVFSISGGATVKNCYSSSDIFATNIDPHTNYRTLICGFITFIRDSVIINCYYSGKLTGFVIALESPGMDSITADFIGMNDNTPLINCHLLYHEDTFAMDIIVECYTLIEDIDLTIYDSIDEMNSLADILNFDLDEPVWVNVENGLPQLAFVN